MACGTALPILMHAEIADFTRRFYGHPLWRSRPQLLHEPHAPEHSPEELVDLSSRRESFPHRAVFLFKPFPRAVACDRELEAVHGEIVQTVDGIGLRCTRHPVPDGLHFRAHEIHQIVSAGRCDKHYQPVFGFDDNLRKHFGQRLVDDEGHREERVRLFALNGYHAVRLQMFRKVLIHLPREQVRGIHRPAPRRAAAKAG